MKAQTVLLLVTNVHVVEINFVFADVSVETVKLMIGSPFPNTLKRFYYGKLFT